MKQTSEQIANKYLDDDYDKRHPKDPPDIGHGNNDIVASCNNNLQLTKENIDRSLVNKHSYKLTRNNIEYILQSAAAFVSNSSVANKLGVTINAVLFHQYRNSKEIKTLREAWLTKLSVVPFSHKRVRLEQYQVLYMQMLNLYNTTKEDKYKLQANKRLESLLDKSRLEIEGNKVTFQGRLDIVHDDPALLEQVKEIIELTDYEEVD